MLRCHFRLPPFRLRAADISPLMPPPAHPLTRHDARLILPPPVNRDHYIAYFLIRFIFFSLIHSCKERLYEVAAARY